jgi:hypothetical protein
MQQNSPQDPAENARGERGPTSNRRGRGEGETAPRPMLLVSRVSACSRPRPTRLTTHTTTRHYTPGKHSTHYWWLTIYTRTLALSYRGAHSTLLPDWRKRTHANKTHAPPTPHTTHLALVDKEGQVPEGQLATHTVIHHARACQHRRFVAYTSMQAPHDIHEQIFRNKQQPDARLERYLWCRENNIGRSSYY